MRTDVAPRDSAPDPPYHEPFDPGFLRDVIDGEMGTLLDEYFRVRIVGRHKIPKEGPLILAGNHSGNAFPYDGMVLDAELWRRDGFDPQLKFRTVYEKELSITWWMRPFGIDDFWRRGGGVDMTFDNFDRLLARGDRVIYYPEGVPGIGKGFGRRYQLQRFHTSFTVVAARHAAPVFPVYIINAEWIIPFTYPIRLVDKVMDKLFHVPFLPLPWAFIAIAWPWAWYLALPARVVAVIGDPIDVRARFEAAGIDPANPDRAKVRAVTEQIRAEMQVELDRHVKKYGRWPFQKRSLGEAWRRAKGRRWRWLPIGWCPAFVRSDRDRRRPPARNRLLGVLRDWDLAGFWVPFGWPLLSLTRAFRRPPYGYRGLSRAERKRREGAFRWNLAERPLPPRDAPPARTAPSAREVPPATDPHGPPALPAETAADPVFR